MSRLYNESGHASEDDRIKEAERMIDELHADSILEQMKPNERQFVKDMHHKKDIGELFYVSVKQIFWLRDLYSVYCC